MKLLLAVTILSSFWGVPHVEYNGIEYVKEEQKEEALLEIAQTPKTIEEKINEIAVEYGVSPQVMRKVIACESSYNEKALGDGGKSRGLVQIHADYHPEITDEEAYDPEYAIRFLAKGLKEGRGNQWTCYRML